MCHPQNELQSVFECKQSWLVEYYQHRSQSAERLWHPCLYKNQKTLTRLVTHPSCTTGSLGVGHTIRSRSSMRKGGTSRIWKGFSHLTNLRASWEVTFTPTPGNLRIYLIIHSCNNEIWVLSLRPDSGTSPLNRDGWGYLQWMDMSGNEKLYHIRWKSKDKIRLCH